MMFSSDKRLHGDYTEDYFRNMLSLTWMLQTQSCEHVIQTWDYENLHTVFKKLIRVA